ncbi:MAG: hypothetical protein NVS1B6_09440 [Steroidobacteraceae bacterium]
MTRGTRGDHVRKIQKALNAVTGARLAEDGVYGARTAACVLTYKTSRKIVNHAYQTKADDIIGELTISVLDAEVALLESFEDYRKFLGAMPVTLKDLKSGKIADPGSFKVQQAVTALNRMQARISNS